MRLVRDKHEPIMAARATLIHELGYSVRSFLGDAYKVLSFCRGYKDVERSYGQREQAVRVLDSVDPH